MSAETVRTASRLPCSMYTLPLRLPSRVTKGVFFEEEKWRTVVANDLGGSFTVGGGCQAAFLTACGLPSLRSANSYLALDKNARKVIIARLCSIMLNIGTF